MILSKTRKRNYLDSPIIDPLFFSPPGINFSHSGGNSTADQSKCQCREPDFETEDRLYQIKIKEHCVDLNHYDYFQGSEAAYIITVIAVLLSLPGRSNK